MEKKKSGILRIRKPDFFFLDMIIHLNELLSSFW